ncbi:unnamed protein product [Coccothraustes coccothraustes]
MLMDRGPPAPPRPAAPHACPTRAGGAAPRKPPPPPGPARRGGGCPGERRPPAPPRSPPFVPRVAQLYANDAHKGARGGGGGNARSHTERGVRECGDPLLVPPSHLVPDAQRFGLKLSATFAVRAYTGNRA